MSASWDIIHCVANRGSIVGLRRDSCVNMCLPSPCVFSHTSLLSREEIKLQINIDCVFMISRPLDQSSPSCVIASATIFVIQTAGGYNHHLLLSRYPEMKHFIRIQLKCTTIVTHRWLRCAVNGHEWRLGTNRCTAITYLAVVRWEVRRTERAEVAAQLRLVPVQPGELAPAELPCW